MSYRSNASERTGLTLVELLVVVTILVMLVGVTIPIMRTLRNGSDVGAAMQKIEGIINAAKTEAIVSGRPASVILIRENNQPGQPNIGYRVALAKSPPPYTGDGQNARAQVTVDPTEYNIPNLITQRFETKLYFHLGQVRPLFNPNSSDVDTWFVRPRDTIKLNYRGAEYDIVLPMELDNGQQLQSVTLSSKTPMPLAMGVEVPFQIFRAPRRSVASTVELPNGVAMWLQATLDPSRPGSGLSLDPNGSLLNLQDDARFFSAGDIGITFAANGQLLGIQRGRPSADDIQQFQTNASVSAVDAWLLLNNSAFIERPLRPVRIDLSSGNLDNPSSRGRFVIGQKSLQKIKS